MQGMLLSEEIPQQGSPPPNSIIVNDMEKSLDAEFISKQSKTVNDSGVYSATPNTSLEQSTNGDSDNQSDRSTPERRNVCPICNEMFTSQHKFTLHIRSHNNQSEDQDSDKGYTCKICHKVLSSSSSLDRHVLVHSGERPFHCKYCGDTFTTNGNMHRHMRTHSIKSDNYESDASDSGSSKSIEFNNNKVDSKHGTKRKLEHPEEDKKRRRETTNDSESDSDQAQWFRCPVCERADFTSLANLDTHLEDNHPEHPIKCNVCDGVYPNNSALKSHKDLEHGSGQPVVGFQNLALFEFSSEKFPHIARRECELNVHKPTGNLRFQCKRCAKAFPCSNSLNIHEKVCLEAPVGLNLSQNVSGDDIRRQEFFSRLHLRDNSPEKKIPSMQSLPDASLPKIDSNKDLADISSILSNINMQQLQARHGVKALPARPASVDAENKHELEEESQDFVLEFRKMKLRGEFPCRLCTAVFPNLRALKGHNRAHLNGNTGTYYCNMCPHSSVDKAALIRHMRTHNGDRPYECALCNYAFTTKANCERHLRNRHSKMTREDVKKSIIYHPSEDPTNEDLNKLTMDKDVKKQHGPCSPIESGDSTDNLYCSTPKIPPKTDVIFPAPDLQILKPAKINPDIFRHNENLKSLKEARCIYNGVPPVMFPPAFNLTPRLPDAPVAPASRIQVKPFDVLKEKNSGSFETRSDNDEEVTEAPMDLSKKTMDERKEEPQDLSKKLATAATPSLLPDPSLLKHLFNPGNMDHTALYVQQIFQLYHNSLWPLSPLLQTPPNMKERMQLTGGSMIPNQPSSQPHVGAPTRPCFNGFKINEPEPQPDEAFSQTSPKRHDAAKPLTAEGAANKLHGPGQQLKPDLIQSPNSVKMVIKNGVLMPKQKQRRYRTERPFTCEHCSARFTLRSNMERHIKQQHPQFWSQRQRSNIGQPGRKPQSVMLKPNYHDMPMSNEFTMHEADDVKEHNNHKLKFALLNHQHSQADKGSEDVKKEEDEDCALVIDENDKVDDGNQANIAHDYKTPILEEKLRDFASERNPKNEEDLVSISRLLVNASKQQQQFKEFFKGDGEDQEACVGSEEDEEGLVASGSTSEGNVSGTDGNRSESETAANTAPAKKKSAYSLAPNRVSCPYCSRKFPWTSSLRRHILTHTGQKPFKCSHCPLLFTTKSNCDRHLLRKHGNSATTIITGEASNANGLNYLMRNVPERPFKCSSCPSSTFSTDFNLKKHIRCKHSTDAQRDDIKGYEAGSSEDEKANQPEGNRDWDGQIAFAKFAQGGNPEVHASTQANNSDLPFKCHLCEGSFADRHEALEHIRDKHASEYDLLMSKNALDANASNPDEAAQQQHDEDDADIRGKFPDYSNRKVICAWCMRRFWSAEDLRRHMRTHTGERPFSCDICRRRFTLKHSMLRHKKKHLANNSYEQDTTHSDEDGGGTVSPPYIKSERDDATTRRSEKSDESDAQEGGGDLISNLLGLRDRSIIDKALNATADDAAELLGVKNEIHE
ncbi:uncharacterized protein LOC143200893 [Rhynchophorus ferrugineus]|uniref:uncharacterized protein LOC143200893 n=1 Tax=Rhynchophorus ferrugineus TaxID=354439 RepID=UPI003FCD0017